MWYSLKKDQVQLCIFAKPNAKKTALVKITSEALHVTVHAKPQEGAANRELIRFIAELFDVPKTSIALARGETSRYKFLLLPLTPSVESLLAHPEKLAHGIN